MINIWPKTCTHDGHDMGDSTVNFFVFTPYPKAAFLTFRKYLGTLKVTKKLRVAYRPRDGEEYTILWPYRDKRPFLVLSEK